ncbi:hypothetical protein HBH70_106810 [Parastagonospora nodorum]|nr:hypothetical protein HBH49_155820 [Parastagonospora nodorum]KAH4105036.1 hypothetical protein HBH46_090130 [Parastagonospora nodorum]KAH4970222.1 hypothetical protein HBI78_041780 [Parastagonospora nodorum]KAH5029784.1 hypothetical protein HBI75_123840 [Parastagonospora nodorum]KAH5138541.1 hypothetical protein HBH70_106810 [Parastagonospora nodorum]
MHCAVILAFYVLTDHTRYKATVQGDSQIRVCASTKHGMSSSHQQLLPGLARELRAKINSLVKQTFVKHHIPRQTLVSAPISQAWSLQAMDFKILSEATTAFSYTPNHFEETTLASSSWT